MKPYRRTFTASAVLLAALSLSGCGDADKWETSTEITLTSNITSVVVKDEVIFTVRSTPPPLEEGYQCETLLEYRAEGAALDAYWVPVPGSGPTRVWALEPRRVEPFRVIARGKCADSKEDWKYSEQLDITVTAAPPPPEPTLPTVTSMTLTADNLTVVGGTENVNINVSAPVSIGCTPDLRYSYTSTQSAASPATLAATAIPASMTIGITTLVPAPTPPGTITVKATGRCTENPTAVVSAPDVVVTVTL